MKLPPKRKKVRDEQDRIAKVEADKKAAEAKEEADKEAAEEARIQVIEDAIMNKKVKAEAKVRIEALKPGKEQLTNWIKWIWN